LGCGVSKTLVLMFQTILEWIFFENQQHLKSENDFISKHLILILLHKNKLVFRILFLTTIVAFGKIWPKNI